MAGTWVKKITKEKIKEIINDREFKKEFAGKPGFQKGIKLIKDVGDELLLPFVVLDISFPKFCEHAEVAISLKMPLHGDNGQLEEAVYRIARKAGLEGEISCTQNGINMKVILSGENLPYMIAPNPFPSFKFNGKSRMVFVTKKELMSGQYSPIE